MLQSHKSQNCTRRLACLVIASALLAGLAAHPGYSSTRKFRTFHKRKGTNSQQKPATTSTKQNGRIAFVSDRDGNNEIYSMEGNGNNLRRLTNNAADDSAPAWSSDGARIVFMSNRDANFEIYSMSADGSNQMRLTNNSAGDSSPDWSPDGTKIVFARDSHSINDDIFVMNADGSGARKIAEGFSPAWSPDGARIAFAREGDVFSEDIYVTNTDGGDVRNLTHAPDLEFNYSPAWSPDSTKLLFVHVRFFCGFLGDSCGDLMLMNADGTDQQRLPQTDIDNPGWSPDGTRITFDNNPSSSAADVFVANSNGADTVNLNNYPARDFDPAWGPVLVPSSIDDPAFFVTQHYRDFLNREPDADGFAFWTNEITFCGLDPQCIEVKRINDSASFFLSIEFQETGYLVYRFYKTSYSDLPNAPVPIKLNEFLPDTQKIGQDVIVKQSGWEQKLEANKQAFAAEFVQRSRFVAAYPTSMSAEQFVDALFVNAGVTPSASDRNAAINEFAFGATTNDPAARARALRRVAENETLAHQEFNRAFVLMQYFGYLRRNPNDAPESTLDFGGYNFWLNKLNSFNGNFTAAEMVKAFLSSSEYRRRFGP